MTAQELKSAFVEKFIAEWEAKMATATDRVRRTHKKPHPEGAWQEHMRSVVAGEVIEEPATGGIEPEYASGFGAFQNAGGTVLNKSGGIRTSVAATVGRDGHSSDRKPWVLVMLPTGPAAMTVEEAYAMGARELQTWPA